MTFRIGLVAVLLFVAPLSAAFTAMPAMADDIDLSKVSCSDFVSDNQDDVVLLLSWIEGYFAKKSDPPIMYADKVKAHAETIHDYCMNHGDVSLFDAAKAVIK